MKIFKYDLGDEFGIVDIQIPFLGKLLTVAAQGTALVAWFRVDPAAKLRTWRFELCATGQSVPVQDWADYVSTVQIGGLVYHVFSLRFQV